MIKIAFKNLGCKVNNYELEKIKAELKNEINFEEVDFKEKADIYIINTCSVTQIADKKSRQMMHKAKKENENAIIVGLGCFINSHRTEVDFLDIAIMNNDKKDTVNILIKYLDDNNILYDKAKKIINKQKNKVRDFIKVEDGCNQFCSYCIIPYLRGRVKSRPGNDILREITYKAQLGIKEVVLTGIHLSSYGSDFIGALYEEERGRQHAREKIIDLLLDISKIPEIKRIRLGSLEPRLVNEEFVNGLKSVGDKFCKSFLLALQSGSDKTLKKMNRHYNTKDYERAVNLLRQEFDRLTITTDIIVGFPQESDEDFIESLEFAKKCMFYNPNVFKFSKREYTKAANMIGQVNENIKNERSNIMIKELQKITDDLRQNKINKEEDILIEEENENYFYGLTDDYMRVEINKSHNLCIGDIVRLKIDNVKADMLYVE